MKNEIVTNIEAARINRTATETREQSSTVLQSTKTCIPPPTHTACKSIVDVCHKIPFIFSEGSGF